MSHKITKTWAIYFKSDRVHYRTLSIGTRHNKGQIFRSGSIYWLSQPLLRNTINQVFLPDGMVPRHISTLTVSSIPQKVLFMLLCETQVRRKRQAED